MTNRRTGAVDHDGESLYYEVSGEGGIPLVLSHGAGGNHAVWFQQVAPFASGRCVVTWDHRGFGRSTDRAGRSGPQVAVGDLLAVLDHLGIHGADLVGQSMGGWTVVGAALASPALARSLVLADTTGGFTSPEIAAGFTDPGRPSFAGDGGLGIHPALGAPFSSREPARAHLYQMLGHMGGPDLDAIFPRLMAVSHSAADAARLTMPVLCIVGELDALIPPACVEALGALLPDARVVQLPGAGHSPYFEVPEAWNAAVAGFLGSLESGAA